MAANRGGPQVDVVITATGDADVRRAVQEVVSQLRRLQAEERQAGAAAGQMSVGVASLAKQATALFAAFQGARAFKDFISEGLSFNSTMENSALGIASLITAQAELTDANGRVLTGTEALNAAYAISEDQLTKLRIAGLKTSATTKDLVVAYQEAVGAGLAAGLSLDQLREYTVSMTQAAGALNLPFNQLGQEVRSILDGTIDRNSRIAKALNITNAEVAAAKERNQLADYLNKKLLAFNIAGERTAKTWSGVKSNMQEAVGVLAGEATKPLFEGLRDAGQKALEGVFDLEKATISDKFRGLLTTAQGVFGDIGKLAAGALGAAVQGAASLSAWLEENRETVELTYGAAKRVGGQFFGLVGDVAKTVGGVVKWGVATNVVSSALDVAGLGVALFRDGFKTILALVVQTGSGITTVLLGPIQLLLAAVGHGLNAVRKGSGDTLLGVSANLHQLRKDAQGLANGLWRDLAENNRTHKFLAQLDAAEKGVKKTGVTAKQAGKDLANIKPPPNNEADGKKALEAIKAAGEAAVAAAKAALETGKRDLDAALEANLVSYREHYRKLVALQVAAVDAEMAAKRRLLAATKDVGDRGKLNADLVKLAADRQAIVADGNAKLLKAEQDLAKKVEAVRARVLEAEGKTAEARRLALQQEFGELLARLLAEGDQAGAQLVRKLFDVELAKAQLAEVEQAVTAAQNRLSTRVQEIEVQREARVLTEQQARQAIAQAYRETAQVLERALPTMQAFAAASGDPRAVENVAKLRVELQKMDVAIRDAENTWKEFGEQVRDVAQNELAHFFDEGISGAGSLSNAFGDMATSVVASLKRIAAQMIATLIIQRAMRALAGPTNTAGDLLGAVVWDTPRFASGGLVTGPGAGTSDSIPARLSDGEYVIRKAAVDQYGVNLFEALNGLRAPRIRSARQVQRFADGGLVRTPAAAGGGSSDSTLAVGLEDGLVLREMESTGGQRVLISAISKNRRAIRRALGVG